MLQESMSLVYPVIAANILACLFIYAAYSKFQHLDEFSDTLGQFNLGIFRNILLFAIPAIELLIGLAFLCRIKMYLAGLIAVILLAAFCIAIIFVIWKGKIVKCSCFGDSQSNLGVLTLVRNGLLLLLALIIFDFVSVDNGIFISIVTWLLSLCLMVLGMSAFSLASIFIEVES